MGFGFHRVLVLRKLADDETLTTDRLRPSNAAANTALDPAEESVYPCELIARELRFEMHPVIQNGRNHGDARAVEIVSEREFHIQGILSIPTPRVIARGQE